MFYLYYFLSKQLGFPQVHYNEYQKYLVESVKLRYPDAVLHFIYNKLIKKENTQSNFFV